MENKPQFNKVVLPDGTEVVTLVKDKSTPAPMVEATEPKPDKDAPKSNKK